MLMRNHTFSYHCLLSLVDGSAELLVGRFLQTEGVDRSSMQILTKWVPKPGPITRENVREVRTCPFREACCSPFA
jgi:aryl-alcohol dehydrogenase-like predicted oxidoreductase